jgi:hypothetical protein
MPGSHRADRNIAVANAIAAVNAYATRRCDRCRGEAHGVRADLAADLAAILDVDGNGQTDALTDGVLIMRAMFGLTGTQATNDAIATNPPATRNTWSAIRNYPNTTCGTNFAP